MQVSLVANITHRRTDLHGGRPTVLNATITYGPKWGVLCFHTCSWDVASSCSNLRATSSDTKVKTSSCCCSFCAHRFIIRTTERLKHHWNIHCVCPFASIQWMLLLSFLQPDNVCCRYSRLTCVVVRPCISETVPAWLLSEQQPDQSLPRSDSEKKECNQKLSEAQDKPGGWLLYTIFVWWKLYTDLMDLS